MVPLEHEAARGYKVWEDEQTGHLYSTAAKGHSVEDGGFRKLQTKPGEKGEAPMTLDTRAAKGVSRALLAVKAMVKKGNTVVFDDTGSFSVNKKTGRRLDFEDTSGGWDLVLELEAPDEANRVKATLLAELKEEAKQEEQKAQTSVHVHVGPDAHVEVRTPGASGERQVLEATTGGTHDMGPFGRRAH